MPKPKPRDDVHAMIRAAVRRHMDLFFHFHDIDEDDMCQEMFLELGKAMPNYNPALRFDTFVFTVVQRKMINKARDRRRVAERDAKAAEQCPVIVSAAPPRKPEETRVTITGEEVVEPEAFEGEFFEGEVVGGDGQLRLPEWLHLVYVQARRLTRDASRQGRSYEPAQALAVAALAQKLELSTRGIRGLFEDRDDLRRVLSFPPLPSHRWFAYALKEVCTLSSTK